MKVVIDDRPPKGINSADSPKGAAAIRLIPETNAEMAALERCLTVKVKFEEFRKWAHPDEVSYGFHGDYGI